MKMAKKTLTKHEKFIKEHFRKVKAERKTKAIADQKANKKAEIKARKKAKDLDKSRIQGWKADGRMDKELRSYVNLPENKKVTYAQFKKKWVKEFGKPTHKVQRAFLNGKVGDWGTIGDIYVQFRELPEKLNHFFDERFRAYNDRFDQGGYFAYPRKRGKKVIEAWAPRST